MATGRMFAAVLGLIVTLGLTEEGRAAWYMQEGAPNDSVSRNLNEMKAKPRPVPIAADPRDARIAALEKQVSELEGELGRLRSSASGNLSDANSRISALEQQLADRDRELASLRSSSGDSAKLASQLSSTQAELAQSKARATDLEGQLAAAQLAAAGAQAGAADKDKLAAELAAEKQRRAALETQLTERDKLASDLAAEKQRRADLEKQLANRDRELAALRGDLSAEMAKLKEAERGLVKALRPEIEKGNITVDVNNERLLINLTSSMLFGSGEDQLKPAGTDALQRIGGILKDYPEYKVEVDGHTDNRPIRSTLKKRFPTNKELSEARAVNGVTALEQGGISAGNITSAGYADTKPVASNTTDEGRQKNRRVEVRVTPKS